MDFGLSEKTRTVICEVLGRFPGIEKAVIYGSRAKGTYKTGSDIDLSLMGEALNYQVLSALAEALDESYIPYTVDLSLFHQIESPALREHIERVGMVFYERAPGGSAPASTETGQNAEK